MAASRSLARAFSPDFPASSQESKNSTRAAEAEVFAICVVAGVSCIGITRELVIFQPTVASLSIPLAEFRDAAKAIALICAKLAEVRQ